MVIWSETTSAPSLPHSCFPFIFCSSIWFNLLFTDPCAVNPLVLQQLIDKDCMLLCFGFLIVFFWTWVKELKATSVFDTLVWHMNRLPYWKTWTWKRRCTHFFLFCFVFNFPSYCGNSLILLLFFSFPLILLFFPFPIDKIYLCVFSLIATLPVTILVTDVPDVSSVIIWLISTFKTPWHVVKWWPPQSFNNTVKPLKTLSIKSQHAT